MSVARSTESSWPSQDADVVHIRSSQGREFVNLREVWERRDLLWMLALRDIKIRYKQTLIGALWAVVQPLATTGIFSMLFGLLGRAPVASDVPYPVTTFCAMLPWQLFAASATLSARSLVTHQNLVRKVYLPRVLIPLAPMVTGLADFAVCFPVLLVMVLAYGLPISGTILFAPVLVGLVLLASVAVGLWLSALNALYRDVQHALPFVIQVWFFLSPVVYESGGLIPERWQWLLVLNPMAGLLDWIRWSVLGTPASPLALLGSIVGIGVLLVSGLWFFRRMERTFVDWV